MEDSRPTTPHSQCAPDIAYDHQRHKVNTDLHDVWIVSFRWKHSLIYQQTSTSTSRNNKVTRVNV